MKSFDCVVIGLGGVGSAALFHAARQGWNVLGIDPHPPGHALGSSHGQSRIIRKAYFEHADYVPLTVESEQMWIELESHTGRQLMLKNGLLQVGNPDGEVVQGVLNSARQHQLPVEHLESAEIMARFPQFVVPDDHIGVYESDAGILLVENCVRAHVDAAVELGARLELGEPVIAFDHESDQHVLVRTASQEFAAKFLIMTIGAWSARLIPELRQKLTVLRKAQHWFATDDARWSLQSGCPTFLFECGNEYFYGFPAVPGDLVDGMQRNAAGSNLVKVARHTGGTSVQNPDQVDRDVDESELALIRGFISDRFSVPVSQNAGHSVCMYTMSSDGHFVIDQMKDDRRIVYSSGMSGHGFKFTPVIGRHLVRLLQGESDQRFEFLRCSRFA